MNNKLTESYKRFTHLFDETNYSRDSNAELLQLKRTMVEGFQQDRSALLGQDCIAPLVDIRIRMNHFFFASNDERAVVDDLLTEAFRNNANLVTEHAVTSRLEKVYKDNNVDWGGHLAIAGSMVAAKPEALSKKAWEHVVEWAAQDGEREKGDRRRAFVDIFARRGGKDFTL